MDYIRTEENGQLKFEHSTGMLWLPSELYGFRNLKTTEKDTVSGHKAYCFSGDMTVTEEERICPCCGSRMHINSHPLIALRHINIGGYYSVVELPHNQFRCPKCGNTKEQFLSFKADGHRITWTLYRYVLDLLATGNYTLKEVSELTGLGKNVVKEIDKKRLQELYTINGEKLIQPEKQARYLGIDEFKLHNGRRYATHIIDLETGHILWIANGKKKQVVYDFIEHVGLEWMKHVEAVACDMNSDFEEAFAEVCPHVRPVFDYFHIVKNFNDKVVAEVRKDEQRRLIEEGDIEAAKALKKTKYILMSNRSTLQHRDDQAANGHLVRKGSTLFGTENITRKGGKEEKYNQLISENALFFSLDLIKETLSAAYATTDEVEMAIKINDIIDICEATGNPHFLWFKQLLKKHFDGIISHATYQISSGKIEGINQKIKTVRRQGYGYPDDEYFFLKLFDISRKDYVRNVPSHRICD